MSVHRIIKWGREEGQSFPYKYIQFTKIALWKTEMIPVYLKTIQKRKCKIYEYNLYIILYVYVIDKSVLCEHIDRINKS